MLANAGIIDHTKQTKTSLKVLRNTARNHVSNYFRHKNIDIYNSVEDLPPNYDYETFLGEFSSYLIDIIKLPKGGSYLSYLSSVYTVITKKYKHLKPDLDEVYSKLRKDKGGEYIRIAVASGKRPWDSAPCPNTEDYSFVSEQAYLGGQEDSEFRCSYITQSQVGGRVNELIYILCIKLIGFFFHFYCFRGLLCIRKIWYHCLRREKVGLQWEWFGGVT